MQITQPASAPTSPLASPNLNSTSFILTCPGQSTVDPNWQASKPTVRERNAAMFNNELMADIRFVVGSAGELLNMLLLLQLNRDSPTLRDRGGVGLPKMSDYQRLQY